MVKAERLITITNDIFDESKHYITIFVLCRRVDDTQEPKVRISLPTVWYLGKSCLHNTMSGCQVTEPHKCESWSWKSWADVRAVVAGEDGTAKIFLPLVNLLRDHPDIEALV